MNIINTLKYYLNIGLKLVEIVHSEKVLRVI